jgi:hypothetical protein
MYQVMEYVLEEEGKRSENSSGTMKKEKGWMDGWMGLLCSRNLPGNRALPP